MIPVLFQSWGDVVLGGATLIIPIAVVMSAFGGCNGTCFTGGRWVGHQYSIQCHLGQSDNWIFYVLLVTQTCNVSCNTLSRVCRRIECHFKRAVDTLIGAYVEQFQTTIDIGIKDAHGDLSYSQRLLNSEVFYCSPVSWNSRYFPWGLFSVLDFCFLSFIKTRLIDSGLDFCLKINSRLLFTWYKK